MAACAGGGAAKAVGRRVKVGVKTSREHQLLDLDLELPLVAIVDEVCRRANIPYPECYAVKYDNSDVYVFDANKWGMRNGDMLELVKMPMNRNEVFEKLSSGAPEERADALRALSILAQDPVYADKFIVDNGHKIILNCIECGFCKGWLLCCALQCLQAFVDHGLISWDQVLSTKCLSRVLKETSCCGGTTWDSVKVFLDVLATVVTSNAAAYEVVFTGMPWERYALLMQDGSVEVMRNCIALLNALFAQGNSSHRDALKSAISNWKIRSVVWTRLTNYGQVDSGLTRALYIFQTQLLGLYERYFKAVVEPEDLALNGKVDFLLKLGEAGFISDDGRYQTLASRRRLSDCYRAMGIESIDAPLRDFAKPAGRLALENLLYFAERYNISFTTAIHENLFSSPEHMCPLVESSISLTKILCRVFRVGLPAGDSGKFLLMYFSHESFFEEVFSVCMLLVLKTWREMKASVAIVGKVLGIVEEQITRALKLNPHCSDINAFRNTLSSLPYSKILKLQQQESDDRKASERQSRAVSQLKASFRAKIEQLVRDNRLNVLFRGARFQKCGAKGNRVKDGYVFVKLSPNQKTLHYGDCNASCEDVDIEELSETIQVKDIETVNTGMACPQARKAPRVVVDLAFSIVVCDDGQPLNLVAPSIKVCNRWLDGLNILRGHKADSIDARGDEGILMDMQVRLSLLETEGVPIPETPPPIPPPPSNFDFSSKYFGVL